MNSGAVSPSSLYLGITPAFADEESRSTCPLLTPSPTAVHFRHPLSSPGFERQLSPSSGEADEISSLPSALCTTTEKSDHSEDCHLITDSGLSCSSSVSVIHDARASPAELDELTSTEQSSTENVNSIVNLLGLSKAAQEYNFISWNWSLIRRWCFWGVMSLTVACVCVIVGYITTIPSRCDPPRYWYQGSLIYQIFPPSFQDTDVNGIGDIKGITSRISHMERLGVKGVRLSYVFPTRSYPEHFRHPENLTQIDPSIGKFKDFQVLLDSLHRRNISLILDLPLDPFFKKLKLKSDDDDEEPETKHVIVNNHILVSTLNKTHVRGSERGEVTDILLFWLNIGVDGFYLEGLENFLDDDLFIHQVLEWRSMLNKYNQGFEKILICSEVVIQKLQEKPNDIRDHKIKLNIVLKSFDLVNVHLDPFTNSVRSIREKLIEIQNGVMYSKAGYPWVYWTTGGMDERRLATKAPHGNVTMAALLTTMALPGTTGLFYGDEIGLTNIVDDQFKDESHLHQLVPMHWSESPLGYGFSQGNIIPWMKATPARLSLGAPDFIKKMSAIKEQSPGLYMHAMWKNDKLLPNTAIRYVDDNVILIERSYPRRHTYLLLANLGNVSVTKDFSSHYYGGVVLLDTTGRMGSYISFQSIKLVPAQALLTKLDK